MKFEVAPVSAINAASRVFNSVELLGKSKAEIDAILKYEPRAKYGYNFAFFPAPGRVVYRFDCGNFGWQFNISLNADGKATAIERKWIH